MAIVPKYLRELVDEIADQMGIPPNYGNAGGFLAALINNSNRDLLRTDPELNKQLRIYVGYIFLNRRLKEVPPKIQKKVVKLRLYSVFDYLIGLRLLEGTIEFNYHFPPGTRVSLEALKDYYQHHKGDKARRKQVSMYVYNLIVLSKNQTLTVLV